MINIKQPSAVEFEESIISGMLLFNECIAECIEVLSPNDFYKSAHQLIFEACKKLYTQRKTADLVTVSEYLKVNGKLSDIGGSSYLVKLLNDAPIPSNTKQYCDVVKQKSILRQLIIQAYQTIQTCSEAKDAETVLQDIQSGFLKIQYDTREKSVFRLGEILENRLTHYEELNKLGRKTITGIPSGYEYMDHLTCGFQKSDLIIIAGRPGMGKTALIKNILINAAEHGFPGMIMSLEMGKEQLTDRALSVKSGVNMQKFRGGGFEKTDWESVMFGIDKLYNLPIYIDDNPVSDYRQMRIKIRKAVHDYNLKIVVIDYLQLMSGDRRSSKNLEITDISRDLKLMAKEFNLPVICLSQLNRNCEQRDNKRPKLSDLRESGAIEQDADLVMFIYRDEVYNEQSSDKGIAEINIAQHRNGPLGTIKLKYHDKTTKFNNLADPDRYRNNQDKD